ncbi:MAG: tRNA uracil 4-sulfurtransferase ThiI [Anaerolineae bacterium]|jgi:thiamine biosynthesis protein ThiI|nr:tRNA 4-thiouridine(8) synthase ThiI [Chloroflexota bacterium]
MGLVLVRYGEIALKGRNRPDFIRRLRRNIRAALKFHGLEAVVTSVDRRIHVETPDPFAALEPLRTIPGIASCSPVSSVPPTLEAITAEAVQQAHREGLEPGRSFRIRARRADKTFPTLSPAIERHVGTAVVEATGASVDLSDRTDVTIGIEVTRQAGLVFGSTVRGPGGLPVGIEGRVVALLSGGLDSLVAAWMMIKRGCMVIPLHIAIHPADTPLIEKQIAELQRYSHGWLLKPVVVPYDEAVAPLLLPLQEGRDERFTCLVCKRAMLAQAERLAQATHAHGIVMGDALGQVASQTLRNLEAVSRGVSLPIYRPLIGMDKAEITALAAAQGLDKPQERPSAPCPYVPSHPATSAPADLFEELWSRVSQSAQSEGTPPGR